MIETIKKKIFKKERSQYQLELLKSEQGYYYIEFSQTINDDFLETKTISLREADIDKVVAILHVLQSDIEKHIGEQTILKPNSEKAKKIIDLYFKNIPIEHISLILNLTEVAVEKVLLEHKIPIVPINPPNRKHYKRKPKK